MHDVSGHTKKDGTKVRAYRRRNPGKKATIAITITVGTVAASGGIKAEVPSRSRSSTKISAEAKAGFKRAEATLVANGHKVRLIATFENECVTHSYGKVHKFLQSHPCDWLARAYLQIGEPDQGLILVAISWVGMPNATLATDYKRLIDTPGAGNITELSRQKRLYKNIEYSTGTTYTSGIHATAVWNVQVKPVFPASVDVINRILADSKQ
jgi:hypothetical protein